MDLVYLAPGFFVPWLHVTLLPIPVSSTKFDNLQVSLSTEPLNQRHNTEKGGQEGNQKRREKGKQEGTRKIKIEARRPKKRGEEREGRKGRKGN